MTKHDRINALAKIKADTDKPYGRRHVWYKGSNVEMTVFRIPLECLIYNKYNGRILSRVKSFEKQSRDLNPELIEDKKLIEEFLWYSKEDRNEFTKKDIVEYGQREIGIVTKDGIIIDGNRRASILNRIKQERSGSTTPFLAVILDDTLEDNPKEIMKLETEYQMGQDTKVDYNPIEKYLKCKQLSDFFELDQIAKMMSESPQRIKEWLEILDLMDDYLEDLGYGGIYTRLDKREGHFVDLNNYLKTYNNKTSKNIKWNYTAVDLADMKAIYFDYIRVPFPVRDCRILADPGKKGCLFADKKLWEDFRDKHFKTVEAVQEKDVDEIRKEEAGADISNRLRSRDRDWGDNVRDALTSNKEESKRTLDDLNKADEPIELLRRAKKTLEAINPNSEAFKNNENILIVLQEIELITKKYKDKLNAQNR